MKNKIIMSKLIFSVDVNNEAADFLIKRDSELYHFNNYCYYSDYEVWGRIKKQDTYPKTDLFKRIGRMSVVTNGMKEHDKEPLRTALKESGGDYTSFTELPDGCCSRMKETDLATNLFLLLDYEQRIDFINSMKVVFSISQAKQRYLSWYKVDHALFRTDGNANRLNELEDKCELSRRIMECPINFGDIFQYPFDINELCEKCMELYGAN